MKAQKLTMLFMAGCFLINTVSFAQTSENQRNASLDHQAQFEPVHNDSDDADGKPKPPIADWVEVCKIPNGLTALPTANSVDVSWNDDVKYVGFLLQGRKFGESAFTNIVTLSPFHTIGGLAASSVYEWRVRAFCTDGGESKFTFTKTVATPAFKSPMDDREAEYVAYPNPFSGKLSLTSDEPARLSVLDATGRLWFESDEENSTNQRLETMDWPAGIYFIVFETENDSITKKMIKQ